jgi:hypothetical protein
MSTIVVQLNFFGPYLKRDEIAKVLDPALSDTIFQHQRDLFQYFFGLPMNALSQEILQRYVEATTEESHTPVVPHTEAILERLLKPLKSAKKNYCLADYAATIALCGVVGEMLAILVWKINEVSLKGKPITEKEEVGLFGRSFEKLGQEKKLEILKTFGFITEAQFTSFKKIQDSRRPYLHLWTADLKNEQTDALDVFKKSFQLFKEVTGIKLADAGSVAVNPLLMKLFQNAGKNSS